MQRGRAPFYTLQDSHLLMGFADCTYFRSEADHSLIIIADCTRSQVLGWQEPGNEAMQRCPYPRVIHNVPLGDPQVAVMNFILKKIIQLCSAPLECEGLARETNSYGSVNGPKSVFCIFLFNNFIIDKAMHTPTLFSGNDVEKSLIYVPSKPHS